MKQAFPVVLRDLAGIAGAGAIVTGVAEMSVPIAMIVAGIMLLGTALLLARRA